MMSCLITQPGKMELGAKSLQMSNWNDIKIISTYFNLWHLNNTLFNTQNKCCLYLYIAQGWAMV